MIDFIKFIIDDIIIMLLDFIAIFKYIAINDISLLVYVDNWIMGCYAGSGYFLTIVIDQILDETEEEDPYSYFSAKRVKREEERRKREEEWRKRKEERLKRKREEPYIYKLLRTAMWGTAAGIIGSLILEILGF